MLLRDHKFGTLAERATSQICDFQFWNSPSDNWNMMNCTSNGLSCTSNGPSCTSNGLSWYTFPASWCIFGLRCIH